MQVNGDRAVRSMWVTFLAGPVLWLVYFLVVYLVAEGVCTLSPDATWLGISVATVVTVAATIVVVAATSLFAVLAWRRGRRHGLFDDSTGASASTDRATSREEGEAESAYAERRNFALNGLLLGGLFAVATLAVGIPALTFGPC